MIDKIYEKLIKCPQVEAICLGGSRAEIVYVLNTFSNSSNRLHIRFAGGSIYSVLFL